MIARVVRPGWFLEVEIFRLDSSGWLPLGDLVGCHLGTWLVATSGLWWVSFFRDLEWFLLREDYFRMSPGTQIAWKGRQTQDKILEYSERIRSLKKTQVEANFYFVHRKIL